MRDKTGKFTCYKKIGALQVCPIAPRENDKGWIEKDGAILFEVAPGTGPQQWDWNRKISFAVGIADLCGLFENLEKPKKLVHTQGETVTKTLEFVAATDEKYFGTYMLKLFEKRDGQMNNVQVPLTGGEYQVLMRMCMALAPHILGWL